MLTRHTLLLLIVVGSLFITGCASNVDVAKQLSEQSIVPPQEGILVAKVINTTGYRLPYNRIYVEPKNVNTSKEIKTVLAFADEKPIGDSAIFAVSLAPGEYSLSNVSSFITRGEGWYTRGTAVEGDFGVFTVEAGKVTDLGTIIYYAKPSDDLYKDIVIRLPDTAQGDVLLKHYPQHTTANEFNTDTILTWEADERDEQRLNQYALAAQNPITYTDEVLAPDGSVYFLGKLGVLLRYAPDEGFETFAVDTNLQLNTFAQNNAGERVVGGYESALYFQSLDGDWALASLPDNATVHHVAFYQENQFDVLYSVDKFLYAARFDKEDLSQSHILNTYDYKNRWEVAGKALPPRDKIPKPHNINSAQVLTRGGDLLLKVTSYPADRFDHFDSSAVETYQFSQDDWKMELAEESKGSDVVDSILTAGAAEVGIKLPGFWSWTGRPTYFTRASESSPWREINTSIIACEEGQRLQKNGLCATEKGAVKAKSESFTFRTRPWFWDADNGLAVVDFSDVNLWSGERKSETKILHTSDGGVSWEVTEKALPKPYCNDIIGLITDRILLSCDGATSDFFESTDRAETWEHVRQQQDF